MYLLRCRSERKNLFRPRLLISTFQLSKGRSIQTVLFVRGSEVCYHSSMPAVQLQILQKQIHDLVWLFTRPAEFSDELTNLFNYYADHTYRPGSDIPTNLILPSYHLPPIILRQLELALASPAAENPDAALYTADALWKDTHLESRQVAVFLLGVIPPMPPERIILRLTDWHQPGMEQSLLDSLFITGTRRLRRETPDAWLAEIRSWSEIRTVESQNLALQALLPIIQDSEFENIPAVFTLLTPLVQSASPRTHHRLQNVLMELTHRSPVETGYYLRQMIANSTNPILPRIARRCMPYLPESSQASLRRTLSGGDYP